MMLRATTACAVLLLTSCVAQQQTGSGVEQAIRDYIEVRQLAELEFLRSSNRDHWTELNEKFIIYKGYDEEYLLEFSRNCYELNEHPVVADVRREPNRVRARFDTLRGCRIEKIFAVNANDVAELTALGEHNE